MEVCHRRVHPRRAGAEERQAPQLGHYPLVAQPSDDRLRGRGAPPDGTHPGDLGHRFPHIGVAPGGQFFFVKPFQARSGHIGGNHDFLMHLQLRFLPASHRFLWMILSPTAGLRRREDRERQ